jgi:hypothetical protein
MATCMTMCTRPRAEATDFAYQFSAPSRQTSTGT